MRIDFYYTNKRINALTRPDTDESQAIVTAFTDFHLKDETSLNNPVFIIVSGNLPETNYCILSGTGATAERPSKYYYFVNDITQVRKTVWAVSCTIDALATWKDYILAQSAFVERSSSNYNPYLTDSVLCSSGAFPRRNVLAHINSDISGTQTDAGTYILTVASSGDDSGAGSAAVGGMARYAMTGTGARMFLGALFSPSTMQSIITTFGSIEQFLGGLHWIPVKYDSVAGVGCTYINIGGAQMPTMYTKRLTSQFYDWQQSFNANLTHYGDFRDNPPYRSYSAKLPFVGLIDLDDAIMCERNRVGGGSVSIRIRMMIDTFSGQCQFILDVDGYHLGTYTANTKVDFPLSVFTPNAAGLAGGTVAKVNEVIQTVTKSDSIFKRAADWYKNFMGGLTGLPIGNAQDISASGEDTIVNVSEKIGGTLSVIGGFGGSVCQCADVEMRVFEMYQNTNVSPDSISALMGRPYHGVLSLSGLSGYCKTIGFSPRGKMSAIEKNIIETAFNSSGVYMTE